MTFSFFLFCLVISRMYTHRKFSHRHGNETWSENVLKLNISNDEQTLSWKYFSPTPLKSLQEILCKLSLGELVIWDIKVIKNLNFNHESVLASPPSIFAFPLLSLFYANLSLN